MEEADVNLPEIKQTPEMKKIKAEQENAKAEEKPKTLYGFYDNIFKPSRPDYSH